MIIFVCELNLWMMEVVFKDKALFEIVSDPKERVRRFGAVRAKLILRRLQTLKSVERLEQLRKLPGRFHELKGDRKGQWACDLDQPYRLIFEPKEIESAKAIVIIVGIVNYH